MKIIVISLFMLLSFSLYSQEYDPIIKKVIKYYNTEKYDDALKLALKADSIMVKDNKADELDYVVITTLIGNIYASLEQADKAEFYFKKTLDQYREEDMLQNFVEYANLLNNYASFLISEERFTEAKPLLIESLEKQQSGDWPKDLEEESFSREQLGELLLKTGEYTEAEDNLKKALLGFQKKSDEYYIRGLKALGELKLHQGLFRESISFYKEVVSRTKMKYGEKSQDYIEELLGLASVYSDISNYNAAIPLIKTAIDNTRKSPGAKSEAYAYTLDVMASVYIKMGDYDNAESYLKQALEVQRSGGFSTSVTLFHMTNLYMIMGDFVTADRLCSELLKTDEKDGKQSGNYLSDQNLQANLYTLMGSYDKALLLYKHLANKSKIDPGEASSEYGTDLGNIANLYEQMGKYDLAEPYALESYKIYKTSLGEKHPLFANSIEQLVIINMKRGDYLSAEKYCDQALEIYRNTLGENHEDYAGSLNDLSEIYLNQGKNDKADSLLNKSVSIVRKKFGVRHPMYANTLLSLAELKESIGKSAEAEPLFLEVKDNLDSQIGQNFSFMAEKEKEQFIAGISSDFEKINSFAFKRKKDNPAITSVSYNNELELKGIVLQSSKALRQAALNSNDQDLIKLYDTYYKNNQLLSKLHLQPPDSRWLSTDSLESVCTQEEKDLNIRIQKLPGFSNFTGIGNQITWNDIKNALKPDEAAIEFITFHPLKSKEKMDTSIIYCSLILKPGMDHPEMIYLFKEEELISLLETTKSGTDALTADKLYKLPSGAISPSYGKEMNKLYRLVWQPIDSLLSEIKTIYYSPAGLLSRISFDAIPYDEKNYLSDKYNMHAVLSTRVVLIKGDEKLLINNSLKPVVYGGINYDADTSTMKSAATRYMTSENRQRGQFSPGDMTRGGGFNYLEGTLSEAEKIQKLLQDDKVNSLVITGNDATEESFKSLNNLNSPVFLHIATHGFFFPEPSQISNSQTFNKKAKSNQFNVSQNPLLRSGLIFAGANHAWKNQPLPGGVEDGILLASEVAEMYLPNTKLVVLSACETGLGDLKGTEGVFGLQRAFKMAGVKFLINSLWQVPDYQTSELMSKFYENWLSDLSIHESFKKAQSFLKLKYPDDPFNWAAFVLIE